MHLNIKSEVKNRIKRLITLELQHKVYILRYIPKHNIPWTYFLSIQQRSCMTTAKKIQRLMHLNTRVPSRDGLHFPRMLSISYSKPQESSCHHSWFMKIASLNIFFVLIFFRMHHYAFNFIRYRFLWLVTCGFGSISAGPLT